MTNDEIKPYLNPMHSAECRLLYAVQEIGGLENELSELRKELERPCCGTFKGSKHRATCKNHRGKSAAEVRK